MKNISPIALKALTKSKRHLKKKYNMDLSFESIDDIYNLKMLAKFNDARLKKYYNIFMQEAHKSQLVQFSSNNKAA